MKRQVAFTLRFNPELYQRIKAACQHEGHSINAFVQDAVARKLAEQDVSALFQAFSLVGEDMDEASVEFAHEAQREVLLKGE
jgi:hypothetical protein